MRHEYTVHVTEDDQGPCVHAERRVFSEIDIGRPPAASYVEVTRVYHEPGLGIYLGLTEECSAYTSHRDTVLSPEQAKALGEALIKIANVEEGKSSTERESK